VEIQQVDGQTLLGALAAALLVMALWGMAVVLWRMRRGAVEERIRARLGGDDEAGTRTLRLWHEGIESSVIVPGQRGRSRLAVRLEQTNRDLGWKQPWQRSFLLAAVVVAAISMLVASLSESPLNGFFSALVLLFALAWYAGLRRTRREALFERQLVDGLELSARALRSGHPLLSSFRLIAEEVDDPVGRIFSDVCQQHEMGVSLEQALRDAAEQSSSPDMRLFSASLSIHLRSGGNIADVVEGIAGVIRQRMRLARRVRILTAQTQLSKRILLGMPVVVFAALHILNPGYARVLYETDSGKLLLFGAVSMMLVGWLAMNRMASVKM
jgi:tight adherence protein B